MKRSPIILFKRLFNKAMGYQFSDQEKANPLIETDKIVLCCNLLKKSILYNKLEPFIVIFDTIFEYLSEDPSLEDSEERPYSQPYLVNRMIKFAIEYDRDAFVKYLLEEITGIFFCTDLNMSKKLIKSLQKLELMAQKRLGFSETSRYLTNVIINIQNSFSS